MKKVSKKVVSVVLAVLMIANVLIAAVPKWGASLKVQATSDDPSGKCGDNLTWVIDSDGCLTISGTGEMTSHPWNDPIDDYYYYYDITTVKIENGVTSICEGAFELCDYLKSITIADSVTSIGANAFKFCGALESITIPKNVTSIGDGAFSCMDQEYNCSLESINVSSDNQYFSSDDKGVLFDKNKKTLILYPKGKEDDSYTIPDSVTTIGNYAFEECYALQSITIPSSVTSIGEGAFVDCDQLTEITIPEGVLSIGKDAFSCCDELEKITIQSSVASIGEGAFSFCGSLTSITVSQGNNNYSLDDNGVLFNKDKTTILAYPAGKEDPSYTIPSSVTSIGEGAFNCCSALTSITIPEGVTSIGDYAFIHCYGLTEITIPDSVESIGEGAFYNCEKLESITIPDSVESIGDDAFYWCSGLKNINVSSGNSGNTKYSSVDGVLFNNDKTTLLMYPNGKTGTSYTIPSSVTSIGEGAFENCKALTSVAFETPSKVASIGDSAFSHCSNLTSINIPASVTSIGEGAFSSCYNLTSVDFGEQSKVTSIGDSAFESCGSLEGVTIPNSVTSIGDYAFQDCGLTSITIPSSVTSIGDCAFRSSSLTSVTIPNSVTSIGDSAFSWCSELTGITIQEGVTSIGDGAFSGCEELTSVDIPSSVTSIGDRAFNSCTKLTSIDIPSSVTSIGDGAFSYCNKLESVTLHDGIKTLRYGVFSGSSALNDIYLPASITDCNGSFAYSDIENVQLDKDFTVIPKGMFSNANELTSVNIPNGVTSIKAGAFYGCGALESLTIPESTTIEDNGISNCKKLSIIGETGSDADKYAEDNDITFISIDEAPTISVTGVKVVYEELTVSEGETFKEPAIILCPSNATDPEVTWASSNSAIVNVNADNTLTGIKEGDATLTVTTDDGGKTDTCKVTVTKKTEASTDKEYKFSISFHGKEGGTSTTITLTPKDATKEPITLSVTYSGDKSEASCKIPDGTYTLSVTRPGHTSYTDNSFTVPTETLPESIILYPGDINSDNDNAINAKDQAAMTAVFGSTSTDKNYKIEYDFNEDGSINAKDRADIVANFGKSGTVIE